MGVVNDMVMKVINDNAEKIAKKSKKQQEKIFNRLFTESLKELSLSVYEDLKKDSKRMLTETRQEELEFVNRLEKEWGESFDILETIIVIALESVESFCNEYAEQAKEEEDKLFYALKMIHARAIQISKECLVLMKNGYADGALSRWRTLHELTVISAFLSQNMGTDLAERYLLHGAVEEYREELSYRKNPKTRQQYTDEAFKEMEDIYYALKKQYGEEFISTYGWASNMFKKQKVYFSDIEDITNFTHLRPYYNTACTTIHSGHNGNVNKLGMFGDKTEVLLCGPSNYGLSEPCQNAAISLVNLVVTFLNTYPSADSISTSHILNEFLKELMPLCDNIQVNIEKEWKKENEQLMDIK